MKLISATKLSGMPGDGTIEIVNYSPNESAIFHEGVTILFQSESDQEWIGNFFDEYLGTALSPILTPAGNAFVFAGPYCYFLFSPEISNHEIIKSYNASDPWIQSIDLMSSNDGVIVIGSKGGRVIVLNADGKQTGEISLGVCEDLRFEPAIDGKLEGQFF